jgi:phosphoserine phosphatase RsbU/P
VLLGDVSGKGVAASMLMAHLNAMFRSLSGFTMPVCEMVERANRLFCESTLASHFATLVCIRAHFSGDVEICNAGHCPVALVSTNGVSLIEPGDLPLGMFATAHYTSRNEHLNSGDTMLVYTDGLSEAQNPRGVEYGDVRLKDFVRERRSLPPDRLLGAWLEDLLDFRGGVPLADDLSAMVVRRR